MSVLVCLAERPAEVISRQELMNRVWPDAFVVERVLTRAISELRRILKDDVRQPSFIETVPKAGYRLVAATGTPATTTIPAAGGAGGVGKTVVGLAGLFSLALLFLWMSRSPGAEPQVADATADLELQPLTSFRSWEYDADLSPDGSRCGNCGLNLQGRAKHARSSTPLAGTCTRPSHRTSPPSPFRPIGGEPTTSGWQTGREPNPVP